MPLAPSVSFAADHLCPGQSTVQEARVWARVTTEAEEEKLEARRIMQVIKDLGPSEWPSYPGGASSGGGGGA